MTRTLTERDIGEIVKLRGLGYTQQQIADRLGVTSAAISYQLKRINKIARQDGDNSAIVTFLLGAGLGLLIASILRDAEKDDEIT